MGVCHILGKTINFNSHQVRVVDIDGAPWFAGADAGLAMGISNPRREIIKDLREDEKRNIRLHNVLGQGNVFISESGLYKLAMRSYMPEAKEFQHWVTSVVLPSIRKDGAYIKDEEGCDWRNERGRLHGEGTGRVITPDLR